MSRPDPQVLGLDVLTTAVMLIDAQGQVVYANEAMQSLADLSRRSLVGQAAQRLFTEEAVVAHWLQQAPLGELRQTLTLRRPMREALPVHAVVSALTDAEGAVQLMVEMSAIDQQLRLSREEHQQGQVQANWELLRNLAHEIKNPLGGIRGAAQLLQHELSEDQREYTRVVISEADRLQALVDRLLAPHRNAAVRLPYNVHEVCERVRAVVLAEFAQGLSIERDYDASVPEAYGDKELLIQAVFNIVRNAAQALEPLMAHGQGRIVLRTRVARQVTMARRHHRLALDLHVIDNGPGIPEALRERVFFPLVSGRDGGTGLGLSLAQTYVQAHEGVIELDSRPGCTDFRILLPLDPEVESERAS